VIGFSGQRDKEQNGGPFAVLLFKEVTFGLPSSKYCRWGVMI
jgi:hypothetical protein